MIAILVTTFADNGHDILLSRECAAKLARRVQVCQGLEGSCIQLCPQTRPMVLHTEDSEGVVDLITQQLRKK